TGVGQKAEPAALGMSGVSWSCDPAVAPSRVATPLMRQPPLTGAGTTVNPVGLPLPRKVTLCKPGSELELIDQLSVQFPGMVGANRTEIVIDACGAREVPSG